MATRLVCWLAADRTEGQGIPEYGLIVALFAIGLLGILRVVL
jgi:Flp pilus assembly pilin Flp